MLRGTEGQKLTEYALLLLFIALVAIAALRWGHEKRPCPAPLCTSQAMSGQPGTKSH